MKLRTFAIGTALAALPLTIGAAPAAAAEPAAAPNCYFTSSVNFLAGLTPAPAAVTTEIEGVLDNCVGDAEVAAGTFTLKGEGLSSLLEHQLSGTGTVTWTAADGSTVGESEITWEADATIGSLAAIDAEGNVTVTSGRYEGTVFNLDVLGVDLDISGVTSEPPVGPGLPTPTEPFTINNVGKITPQ